MRRARAEAPKKAAPVKQRRAASKKPAAKRVLRAIQPIATTTGSSPDGMLLAAGLALLGLAFGGTTLLALSVRSMRTPYR